MSTFIENLKEKARTNLKTIVLAEGEEVRSIKAAGIALKEGYAKIILIGKSQIFFLKS